jgi:hypothetical protein
MDPDECGPERREVVAFKNVFWNHVFNLFMHFLRKNTV